MKNIVDVSKMSDRELDAMKDQIVSVKLDRISERLEAIAEAVDKTDEKLEGFKKDLPLFGVECDNVSSAVRRKGVECLGGKKSSSYNDPSIRARVYADIYGQLKREFGVSSYKAIKRSQADDAVKLVISYMMPMALTETVEACNSQAVLEQVG